MPTLTTNYGLSKPLVNDATDEDLWGGELNDDMDGIDGLMKTAINFVPSSKTANFSVTSPTSGSTSTGDSKKLFLCDATSGVITATLPAASAAGAGFEVAFKKIDVSVNAVNVTVTGSDKIDGQTTSALNAQYKNIILVSNGVDAWEITSSTVTLPANVAYLDAIQTFTAVNTFSASPVVPTLAANDSTTKAANSKFVIPTASTIGANTVRYNPDGTIEQWGVVAGSIGTIPVSFPAAFPNACHVVLLTPVGNPGGAPLYLASPPSTSGFSVVNASSSINPIYWEAKGY